MQRHTLWNGRIACTCTCHQLLRTHALESYYMPACTCTCGHDIAFGLHITWSVHVQWVLLVVRCVLLYTCTVMHITKTIQGWIYMYVCLTSVVCHCPLLGRLCMYLFLCFLALPSLFILVTMSCIFSFTSWHCCSLCSSPQDQPRPHQDPVAYAHVCNNFLLMSNTMCILSLITVFL